DGLPTLVRVRGTKKAWRDRYVPVVANWQRKLLALVGAHADGMGGALFSPWANVRRSLANACRLAGLPHFSPHMARHTYSHAMKMEGLPHEEIAPALGHRDTRMLDHIYGRAEGAELAELQRRSIAVRRAGLRVIAGAKHAAG